MLNARFLRVLTLLALLLAPAGMLGSHAAMAGVPVAAAAASDAHCAEMAGGGHEAPCDPQVPAGIDCMIACSCMPPLGAQLGQPPLRSAVPEPAMLTARLLGLSPQAETPPPRLS